MLKKKEASLILQDGIENRIFFIRGKKVMLDRDLAEMYGVPTKRLNEQVRRNIKRFPEDFMFQLNAKEFEGLRFHFGTLSLRSQIATSNRGGRRYLPYVFTEPGVAMLSSVLNSERAIQVNIQIIRTFIKLREMILTHKDLKDKIEGLERKYSKHDKQFKIVFDAIKHLLEEKVKSKNKLGFLK